MHGLIFDLFQGALLISESHGSLKTHLNRKRARQILAATQVMSDT